MEHKIIVNGRTKICHTDKLKLSDLLIAAFGFDPTFKKPDKDKTVFTVTYSKGHNKNKWGSMVNGDTVFIKDDMVFNVTATNKS